MTTGSDEVSFAYREKEKSSCTIAIEGDYEVVDALLVEKFIDMVTSEWLY